MLRRWEVEWELRELHPFRPHLLEQRRSRQRERHRFRIALGVFLGVVIAGTFLMVRIAEEDIARGASPQSAVWGAVHRRPFRLAPSERYADSEPSTFWVPRYDPGSQFGRQFPRRTDRDGR